MRRIRKLLDDIRALAAVEFAILAPVLLLLIMGTIEAAHLLTVRVALEGAVAEAARTAMVSLDVSEEDRDEAMREYIRKRMAAFPVQAGGQLEISTKVYRSFGSSYPEGYEDTNGNGEYDPPSDEGPGEPFDDRNRNGERDVDAPIEGLLGGPGDVVSYHAEFPSALYFTILSDLFGAESGFLISASTVLRNEPVRRDGSTT